MNVPESGAVLGGKYLVLSTLGRGGMGTVLRARNTLTGKEVALKWMHSSASLSSEAAGRLLREAEAASRLNHPNVVNVFDVMYEGDTLFLVMELLEGETLRTFLDRERRPDLTKLITLLLPAMGGVARAHERGVIHRDLKPDNIFLVRGSPNTMPVAKVVDFGVAKVLNSEGMTLTRTGTSLGTPLYMSLEQLRADEDIDHRTDVYAFGVILYEAITECLPYNATTITEFAIKVATTTPTPIKQLRPDVPSTLAYLVEWAIAKNRDQRLPDMAALMRELEPFAHEQGFRSEMTNPDASLPLIAAATPPGTDSLRETTPYPTPATFPFAAERDTSSSSASAQRFWTRRTRLLLAAAVLCGLGGGGYWLQQGRSEQTSTSAATMVEVAPAMERAAAGSAATPEPDLDVQTTEAIPSGTAEPPPPAAPAPLPVRAASEKPIKRPQLQAASKPPQPAAASKPPQPAAASKPPQPAAASKPPQPAAAKPKPAAPLQPRSADPDPNDLGGRL